MSKKGIARSIIVGFMLAMMAAVVFLIFIRDVGEASYEFTTTEKCKLSVERNAKYRFAGINLGDEIDCPTRNLVLDRESEEEAKMKIANSMYTCWKQFGQGRLDLFGGESIYCNICYIIDLKIDDPINDFEDYLMETPSPTENLYYYDYLSSFKTEKAQSVVKKKLDLDGIITDSELSDGKYAVIFVYAKGEQNFKKVIEQLTAQSSTGKVVTPIALGTGIAAGAGIGLAIIAAPVAVPVIVVVGTVAIVGVGAFSAVEYVGSVFNPDRHTEWIALNVLSPWNPDETPDILKNDLGCENLV